MIPRRLARTLAVLSLTLAGCSAAPDSAADPVVTPRPAPILRGIEGDAQPFSLSALRGRVVLIVFGYTFCPDVCPMTLASLGEVARSLGDRRSQMEFVFVSIDPARDTLPKLATYVPAFGAGFHGVRIDEPELRAQATAYGVVYGRGGAPSDPNGAYYTMDHTGTVFGIDRSGKIRLQFPYSATAEDMLPYVLELLEEEGTDA